MRQAISLARKGLGRTTPNPPVGALVVREDKVVGRGYHPVAGQPHAEVFALRESGQQAHGADLYVTLEPCCHQGRTGPCTEEIIAAGVARVYIGATDPNPQVSGKGAERLRQAGIEVNSGLLADECQKLIAPFAKHVTTGLPYVLLKAAMTLDGKIATADGDSRWISCPESRELVHRLRDQVDAIIVGSGTILADNPQLTTRLADGGRDPVRIVFDGYLRTSPQAVVYTQESVAKTLLVTAVDCAEQALQPYRELGTEIVQVERSADGFLNLKAAMSQLGAMNLQSLLLEGGSALGGAMLRSGLVDKMMLFIAPKLLGGSDGHDLFSGVGVAAMREAYRLTDMQVTRSGDDILIEGEVATCSPD